MNSTLVILGMHRSGTSLCANWLSRCGLNLGDRIMPAGIGNEQGHFEDLDFHDLHEDVFKSLGIEYGGLESCQPITLSPYFQKRLESLVTLKNNLSKYWGWKEPRTCLFIKEYQKVLVNPKYLVLYRPCAEVVTSLWNRSQKENTSNTPISSLQSIEDITKIHRYAESWIRHNEEIIELLNQIDSNTYRVASIPILSSTGDDVIQWLNTSGFQLDHVSFNTIYNQELLTASGSSEIDCLTDQQQIRIREIEHRFQLFLKHSVSAISKDTLLRSYRTELAEKQDQLCSLHQEVASLNQEISSLNEIIQSAVTWQKNWKNKVFHKWRPKL